MFRRRRSGGAIKGGREGARARAGVGELLRQEERGRTGIISTMGQIRVPSQTLSPQTDALIGVK